MLARRATFAILLSSAFASLATAEPLPPLISDALLAPGTRDPLHVAVSSDGFRYMGFSGGVARLRPDGTIAWTYPLPPLNVLNTLSIDPSSGVYIVRTQIAPPPLPPFF